MDLRIIKRLDILHNRMETAQGVSLRALSKNRSEETAFYRLINNEKLTEKHLLNRATEQSVKLGQGKHVLLISDTTDIDMSRHRRRIKADSGLGYIGDGKGYGYNCHATIAVDAQEGTLLGLADVYLWSRMQAESLFTQLVKSSAKRNKLSKLAKVRPLNSKESAEFDQLSETSVVFEGQNYTTPYSLPFEARESHRWLACALQSQERFFGAARLTHIMDMEGDIYDIFVKVPSAKADLVIRCDGLRHCSAPTQGSAQKGLLLKDYRQQLPSLGTLTLPIRDTRTHKTKQAKFDVRCAPVRIYNPGLNAKHQRQLPPYIDLYVVYAYQINAEAGEKPLNWCILTTHEVTTFEQACQITSWYAKRWLIELVFRIIKTEGFDIESSELENGYAIRKLGILTLHTAMNVLQLKQARDGDTSLPIEAVFEPAQIACLEAICPEYEGNTDKQKNPFFPKTLPWATWIIARLGGWKPGNKSRPPGVLTLKRGLDNFNLIYIGFVLRL